MEWYMWVTIGLGVATAITGGFVRKLSTALKETGEAFTAMGEALEDGEITKKEAGKILKELGEAKTAWLALTRR